MMQPEPEFNFLQFIEAMNVHKVRYLLIGRWAVAQHGVPVVTNDYDFWIHPADRTIYFSILKNEFDAEVPSPHDQQSPLSGVTVGMDRIDAFFYRKIANGVGQELTFDDAFKRADVKKEPGSAFFVRIASIPDLILLKKMPRSDASKRQRDDEDIRQLQAIQKRNRRRSK